MLLEDERLVVAAVLRWIEIRAKHGSPTLPWLPNLADADHSALLARLLAGDEPLPEPPPLAFSYPWYGLVETGRADGCDVRFPPSFAEQTDKSLLINQCPWHVVEVRGPADFIVTYAGQPTRYRVWRDQTTRDRHIGGWDWAIEREQ